MHMYGVSIFESRTENPCVGGSIPPLGTILTEFLPSKSFHTLIMVKILITFGGFNIRMCLCLPINQKELSVKKILKN